MKKFVSAVVALAMVLSVCSMVPLSASAASFRLASGQEISVTGENLVKNNSFEQSLGDVSQDPNTEGAWTMWGMDEKNVGAAATAVPDGEKALHLALDPDSEADFATVKQEIALKSGASYVFSAYLEAPHNIPVSVNVALYDDNGRILSFTRAKDSNGVLEFQQVCATFEVPSDAVNPRVTVSAGVSDSDNQKYIDNIELYEISDISGVEIEEKQDTVGSGRVTVSLSDETRELELKLYGDNTSPTSRYDNRSKYIEDILYNVNRDFGGPATDNATRVAVPVDVYSRETFEAAVNTVKENPKSNPILSTDYIDAYYEQVVALRPAWITYLEQMVEADRMGITIVPVSNPWWQYMRLEEGQEDYTEEQWAAFYSYLWGDAWRHCFARGYIYAKYFGQTNYNMGNEPDNWDNGAQKFIDWKLYAYEAMAAADGWRTGVMAAGYSEDDAQLWGPTLAGWNEGAWNTIAEYGHEGIDVYDYHTYGGGTSAHSVRIQNFKSRIEKYDPEADTKKVSASEFNWQLSGDSYDWLNKMPGCISHIQIMRTQALEGLYASIRFSFGEMFFQDSATGRYLIPERMYYAIRQFNRTLTNGNVIVEFDLEDASTGQDFFVTKNDSEYFVHFINNTDSEETSSLVVDLSKLNVPDLSPVILREMSEEKNDEVVAESVVQNGQVEFDSLKGGAMYLVEIGYGDYTAPAPTIHRAFSYADSIEVWWENRADYTSFNVYRSVDGGEYSLVAENVYNAYYEDYDVEEGKEYSYQIQTKVFDKLSPLSEAAGPIVLKSMDSLPYMGDFEGGTLAGFDVVGDFEIEEYRYVHNAVGTAENEGDISALLFGGSEWKDYTVNTTVNPRDLESGSFGKVGFYARYVDENNYYLCALDSVERTVSITKVKDGVRTLLASKEIPEALQINSSKSLPLSLTLNGDSITFYAEMSGYDPPVGQRSASVTVTDTDFPTGGSAVFVSDGAKMAFSSVKVVEVFSDLFQGTKSDDWEELSGDWSIGYVADGDVGNWWYTQSDSSGDDWKMALATSGAILDGYVAAKVMTSGTAAIISKYKDENNFMRYEVSDGVLSVIARVNGDERTIASAALPEQSHDYYTIVVDFDRNYETIAVGGKNILSYHYYIPELSLGRFGVATKGSAASFDQFLVSATSVTFEMPYFEDCDGHWAEDDIKSVAQWGYVTGYEDGTFHPDETVTRAQFAAMVSRLLGVDKTTALTGTITDIDPDIWYAGTVQWAYDNGIIPEEMLTDGAFEPDKEITREEMTAMIINVWKKARPRTEFAEGDLTAFEDADEVSDWAREAISYALEKGVIEGVTETTLGPGESTTRAQAAVMLNRLYKAIW